MPDAAVIGFGPLRAVAAGPPSTRRPRHVPDQQDLVTLLRARTPLILVESAGESRVVAAFRHAIEQSLRPLYRWSLTDGLERLDIDDSDERESPPDASLTLNAIKKNPTPGVY